MWPSSAGKGKSRTGAAVLVLSSVEVRPVQPTNEHHRTSLRSCDAAEFSIWFTSRLGWESPESSIAWMGWQPPRPRTRVPLRYQPCAHWHSPGKGQVCERKGPECPEKKKSNLMHPAPKDTSHFTSQTPSNISNRFATGGASLLYWLINN